MGSILDYSILNLTIRVMISIFYFLYFLLSFFRIISGWTAPEPRINFLRYWELPPFDISMELFESSKWMLSFHQHAETLRFLLTMWTTMKSNKHQCILRVSYHFITLYSVRMLVWVNASWWNKANVIYLRFFCVGVDEIVSSAMFVLPEASFLLLSELNHTKSMEGVTPASRIVWIQWILLLVHIFFFPTVYRISPAYASKSQIVLVLNWIQISWKWQTAARQQGISLKYIIWQYSC